MEKEEDVKRIYDLSSSFIDIMEEKKINYTSDEILVALIGVKAAGESKKHRQDMVDVFIIAFKMQTGTQ